MGSKFRSLALPLEPRILFDGAAAVTADAQTTDPINAPVTDSSNLDPQTQAVLDAFAAPSPVASVDALFNFSADQSLPQKVVDAKTQAESLIAEWVQQADAAEFFQLFAGGQSTASDAWLNAVNDLKTSYDSGTVSVDVEIRTNEELQGALGAFAIQGVNGLPTIYLNANYVEQASVGGIKAVLVEEAGHYFDAVLNGDQDSVGDEGRAFSALLINGDADLSSNLSRNDHRSLWLDGQSVMVEESANLNIAQVNYVPLPEADIQTALKSIAGATKVSGNIQTVVAITATTDNTVVVYDQWEDGYETNLNLPTSANSKVWIYKNSLWYVDSDKDGSIVGESQVVVGPGIAISGQTLILSNAVDPASPSTMDYDGRDKIGSSKAISVTRAGWSTTPGTVLAGAVSTIDAGNAGKTFVLPIGQNTVTAATDVSTSRLFEYTSVEIMATVDNTTITIDKDGNGTVDMTVTLNEGQTTMVNGGIFAGAKITADKGISVNAIAGDVGSAYDNRWFTITPYEQWSNSYYAPVGTTLAADPAYVFLYNPDSTNSITVYYDNSTSTGNSITVAANTAKYVQMTGSAAHFYTRAVGNAAAAKFYAIGTVDSDATSHSTHDWSYSLVPESNLTTKFVAGWAPGVDNVTRSIAAGDANGSPLWVTTTADTSLYVDSTTVTVKNSAGTAIAGTAGTVTNGVFTAGAGSVYKYTVKALESYRLSDSDKDQSGLSVYTLDGTLLTGAWGEDPSIAGAGTPYLDMGYTLQPLPEYVFTKDSAEAPNGGNQSVSDGDGTIELGEQVQYTLTIVNRSVVDMFSPNIKDSWTPAGAVNYVAGTTQVTVYDTDGTTVLNQFTIAGGAFPLSGSGYTLADANSSLAGDQGLSRGQKIVVTYNLKLPSLTDTAQLNILAGNNYQIDNSAQLNDLAGTTKLSLNLTSVTPNVTDGEVFLYDSLFTSVQTTYKPADAIGLQVTDSDQNKNAASAETLTVTVTNNTTGEYETRTLTETGVNTGIFRGSLATSTSSSNNGNNSGTLYVANGNSIKVEYTDPTTGAVFDNPTLPGTSGSYLSGNANIKTANVLASLPVRTDGLVQIYYDASYTQTNANLSEGDSVYIQVNDNDQNYDAGLAETLTVLVTNTTSGETETVTLTETGANTGIFRGNILTSTSSSDATNNSGVIKASLGESLKVEYTDPISSVANPVADTPATPGSLANTDIAAVAKTKILYLSADGASGDGTGELDRVDPYATSDSTLETTFTLTGSQITNNTPIVTVSGNAAGSTQTISSTASNLWGQSFVMSGTTISQVQLKLYDNNTRYTNSGKVFAYLRSSWDGPNLASASATASTSSSTYTSFDFNLTGLTSGSTYYIVVENQASDSNSNSAITWKKAGSGSGYSSGTAWNSSLGNQAYDFAFKVLDSSKTIKVSYAPTSGTSSQTITGVSTLYAQGFKVDGTGLYTVDKVTISLKDSNGVANTGYVYAYLRSTINGDNLGWAYINSNTLSSSYQNVTFDFTNNPSLAKGTAYYVVLDNQSSASIDWEYANSNSYSNGSYWANSSSASATYTSTSSKDFILNVFDASATALVTVPYASNKASIASNAYAGQSFVVGGTGSYVLDKVQLSLDDPDTANTGNLTLGLYSGSINGTLLTSTTFNSASLSLNGALANVSFDLTNQTLTKGTTYYLKLSNGSNNSIDWAQSNYNAYSGGSAYINSTSADATKDFQFDLYEATTSQVSAVFSQSIPMAEDFSLPAGGALKVVTYISGLSGGTPTSGNISANLSYGSRSTLLNMSDFTFTSTGASTGYLTWNGNVASNITVAAGQAITLTVTNNQSGLAFSIDYDKSTMPSRIELSTPTVIKVEEIAFYDDSYANNGNQITGNSVFAGAKTYIRVKVSDPFGDADVNALKLAIDGPGSIGDVAQFTLNDSYVVDTNDNGLYKVYEYAWTSVDNTGSYAVNVIANEGYEGTITASDSGSIAVAALDLGTPSKTEFITALSGSNVGTEYASGNAAYLRVTDLDEAGSGTVVAKVNGVSFTLLETGASTGVFELALTGTYTEGGVSGKSFTSLTTGTVLVASYTDNGRSPTDSKADSTDTSTATVTVPDPTNTDPLATDNDRSINENATASGTNLITSNEGNGIDSDADSNTLTVVAINGNNNLVGTTFTLASGATLNVATNGNYTYDPNGVFNFLQSGDTATDSFDYTISDGHGGVSTATVTITINGVSDPSVSVPDSNGFTTLGQESVSESSSLSSKYFTISAPAGLGHITVAGTTISAASLTNASSSPVSIATTLGTLVINGYNVGTGRVTYSYTLTASYQNHSSGAESVIDTISVTVTDSASTTSSPNSIAILVTDTSPTANADARSVTEGGFASSAANLTGNVLASGVTGDVADTASADTPVTVTAVIAGNTTPTTSVTSGSTSSLNATSVTGSYGTLLIGADGSYSYDLDDSNSTVDALNTGSHLTETFTYKVTDADGSTSITTLTITINGLSDGPPILTIADNNGASSGQESVAENTIITGKTFVAFAPLGLSKITLAGTDVSLAQLNAASGSPISISTGKGSLTITAFDSGTGTVTYSYDPTGNSQDHSLGDVTDSISISVTDSLNQTTPGSLTVLISDTSPTANSDTAAITEDASPSTTTGNVITTGAGADTASADGSTTVVGVAATNTGANLSNNGTVGSSVNGTYGTITIAANGSYTYTLDNANASVQALKTGQTITDVFTYTIQDADGSLSHSTLSVTVNGANDTPVITVVDVIGAVNETDTVVVDNPNTAATESGSYLIDTGSVSFDDIDVNDTSSVTVALVGAHGSSSSVTVSSALRYQAMFDFAAINGNGGGNWTGTNSNTLLKSNYANLSNAEFIALAYELMSQSNGTIGAFVVNYTDNTQTTIDYLITKASITSIYNKPASSNNGVDGGTLTGQQVYVRQVDQVSAEALLSRSAVVNNPDGGLGDLLKTLKISGAGVAVAVNDGTVNWSFSVDKSKIQYLEAGESITVTYQLTVKDNSGVSATSGGSLVDTATQLITITINGATQAATFSINDVTVNEAAGTATFTVTRSGATGAVASVDYATSNGTATAGADYAATNGSLSFAIGETSKTFTVAITDDTVFEGSESFSVTLSNASGATISDGSGEGTIKDDGTGSGGTNNDTPTLSVSSPTVTEGGIAEFTVSLSNASTQAISFTPSLSNGTATLGTDTAATSSLEVSTDGGSTWTTVSGAVTIAAGQTSLKLRIATTDDAISESSETFSLSTGAVTGSVTNPSGASGTATITDNDIAPTFSINDVTVNEAAGTATFTVTRSGATGAVASVDYATSNGTATAGADYAATNGSLSFVIGETSKTFTVAITDDTVFEGSENFSVTLSNASGATISDGSGEATIKDDGTGNNSSGGTGNGVDDDRSIAVYSYGPVNEGSTYAMFTVNSNPGLSLQLALGNSANIEDRDATTTGFSFEWSNNGIDWQSSSVTPVVPASGIVFVRVNITTEADAVLEGAETFTLTASLASGVSRSATGIATIIDNGTGTRYTGSFDSSNPVQDTGPLDDDRGGLSVPDVTVNEGSPYVVFKVSASSNQRFSLALSSGPSGNGLNAATTNNANPSDNDYENSLQIYNGTNWVNYSGGEVGVPQNGSLLLVRVPLHHNPAYEGAEVFTLTATSGITSSTGRAIIGDYGSGAVFNESGAEDPYALKVDDRVLKVDSPIVNEGSQYAVFKVTGISGNDTQLALEIGSGTGYASITPNLQFWNGTNWVTYNGQVINRPDNGELLVRVDIHEEQDSVREGTERFNLVVTGSGGPATGIASIRDDGTGVINQFNQVTGAFSGTSTTNLDDDFDLDGITPNTENALSSLAASQGIGSAKDGDMNGDGLVDAYQNALATLAWIDVDKFTAGNNGTLTDSKPIISIAITDSQSGEAVSTVAQLENIQVIAFNESSVFGSDAANSVSYATDNSSTRNVTLADGSKVSTEWDPIKFSIANQADAASPILGDIDSTRAGTQVRVYIDVSAAKLDKGDFNSYIKFVSQAALDAASAQQRALTDLDGNIITKAGWYDFTQRTSGGDGARFVIENGKIVGIELILTDNAFGDDGMALNSILDPGVPVYSVQQDPNAITVNASQIVDFNGSSSRGSLASAHAMSNLSVGDSNGIHIDPYPKNLTVINWPGIGLRHDVDRFGQAWGETRTEIMEKSLATLHNGEVFKLPPEALMGLDTNDSLRFDASLADGHELPDWIVFDRNNGSMSLAKHAPLSTEPVKLKVVATDTKSNQVTVKVILKPGQTYRPNAEKTLRMAKQATGVDKPSMPLGKMTLSEQVQLTGSQKLHADAANLLNTLAAFRR